MGWVSEPGVVVLPVLLLGAADWTTNGLVLVLVRLVLLLLLMLVLMLGLLKVGPASLGTRSTHPRRPALSAISLRSAGPALAADVGEGLARTEPRNLPNFWPSDDE